MEIDDETLQRIAIAVQEQGEIDRDSAGPREPYDHIEYKGVIISSRYRLTQEFRNMRRVVDALPEITAGRVESISCDSHACDCFTVMLTEGSYTPVVIRAIWDAFRAELGGWNGLTIYGDEGQSHDFDCFWPEEGLA